MAEEDETEVDQLLNAEGPNAPQRVTGSLTGPRPYVSPAEAQHRRQNMAAALIAGASKDSIFATFVDKPFYMSEQQIIDLMRQVRASWLEEDAENADYERSAASRRLKRHVQRAADAGRWAAVAALEKVLADVTGTAIPQTPTNTNQRLHDAVITVLGELALDPERLRQEIERQRRAIDTEGEEVALLSG